MQIKKYYVFGAGSGGQYLYLYFKKYKPEIEVLGFIDNFSELKNINQKSVYKLEEIELQDNEQILIASHVGEEIAKQLDKKGFRRGIDYINIGNVPSMLNQYETIKENLEALNKRNVQVDFLNLDDLLKKKTSDTLFILGCGNSINEITPENWQEISKHDSWGFNYFAIHDYKPSFYTMEFPMIKESKNIFWNIKQIVDYKNIKLDFIKDFYSFHEEINPNFNLFRNNKILKNLPNNFQSKSNAIESKRFLDEWSLLEPNVFFAYTTTALTILDLGLKMGYTKIVFCGVDISSGYFYDLYPNNENFDFPKFREVYSIVNPYKKPNQLEISDLIDIIQTNNNKKIDIYVSSRISELSKKYELYPWKAGLINGIK